MLGRRIVFILLALVMLTGFVQAQEPLPIPPAPDTIQTQTDALRAGNPNNYNCVLSLVVGCSDLKVLYTGTGGASWTNNSGWWQSSVCNFYGVDCLLVVMTEVNLPGNNLTGTLPGSLSTLLGVVEFDLSRNHLTGGIPLNLLSGILQLRGFDLSGNMLTGPLPDQLSTVTGLFGGLNVNYNMIEDTRPLLLNILISTGWINTQTIPPRDLGIASVGPQSITLDWSAIPYVADGGGYDIRYRVVGSGSAWTIAPRTAGKAVESIVINGLAPQTAYEFEIRTVTPAHVNNPNTLITEWSKGAGNTTISATTGTNPPETPDAPTGVIVDVTGQTSLNVEWLNLLGLNSNVQISTDGINWVNISVDGGLNTLDILNLQCGTNYHIRVQSILGLLFSLFSNVVQATTAPCSVVAPPTPTGLNLTVNSATSITAAWNNAGNGLSYILQYSSNGQNWTTINVPADTFSHTVNDLDCGTTYQFRVSSYNLIDLIGSIFNAPVSATTLDCVPTSPSMPMDFNVQATGPTSAMATWTSAGAGLSYEIWYSANGVDFSVNNTSENATMATIEGLVCATNYTFRIRSVRTSPAGSSDFSADKSITTQACPVSTPAVPTGLTAVTTGPNSVFVAWSSSGGGISYVLGYSSDGGSNWTTVQIPVDTQSIALSPLACNTTYSFRVLAKNSTASSAYSGVVTALTGLCAADPVELLVNGDFEINENRDQVPDSFRRLKDQKSRLNCKAGVALSGSCAYQFSGTNSNQFRVLRQRLNGITGFAGDVIVVSYSGSGKNIPNDNGTRAAFIARVIHTDGTKSKLVVEATNSTYSWTRFSATKVMPKDYTKIVTRFIYFAPRGKFLVDLGSVTRESVSR